MGPECCATPLTMRIHEATAQDISQGVKAWLQMGLPNGPNPKHTSKGQQVRST